jgi:hypothetical protein
LSWELEGLVKPAISFQTNGPGAKFSLAETADIHASAITPVGRVGRVLGDRNGVQVHHGLYNMAGEFAPVNYLFSQHHIFAILR